MTSAEERLVNLAMLIASSPIPVTAAEVRAQVAGYPPGQDEPAFLRMFERDKEGLRAAGLVIAVDRAGDAEAYRLDAAATFAGELELTPEEATLLRAAGAAMLADPAFPFRTDLAMALAKLSASADAPVPVTGPVPVAASTADEAPEAQGEAVAELAAAANARKRVHFAYTNNAGQQTVREVEPYGLFARDGRWYLVGRDTSADDMRVFAVTRVRDLSVESARPKSPDFERPADFDLRGWAGLSFQWGTPETAAVLRFEGTAALRAAALTAGQGRLEEQADGSVLWSVAIADARALAGWAVENGPGITIVEPATAREALATGLAKVVSTHAS